MLKPRPHLNPIIFLIVALFWGQWVSASHQHDPATSNNEVCDICLVAKHGKSGLASAVSPMHVLFTAYSPTIESPNSLISRPLPRPSSRAPPQFSV